MSDNGNGTLTITKKDANGHTISTQDYDVEFTNELLGSLKITKAVTVGGAAWSDSSKASPADGTYTFGVYSDSTCSTQVVGSDVAITVTNGQSNTAEVPNLSQGTYYVQEKSSSNVAMTLDTTVHPVTVTAGQSGNNVVDAGIATVTNNYPVTSVTVDKTWLNGSTNINSTIQNAYVTVELRADGNAVTVDASGAAIAPVTLDGYTDTVETVAWTYTWTNLPKYDSTGAEISYTVVETSAKVETNVGTGTDLAPTDATGSMATGFKLTNTLPKTNIKAKKNWPENQTVPANTTVELTLKGTVPGEGENAEPVAHTITGVTTVVTLNGTEDPAWEYEWANLPKYDTAGKEITYTVTETAYTIGGVAQTVATADSSATEGYQFSFTNTLPSTNIKIVKVEQGTETTLSGAKFQLKTSDGTDVGEEITIPASGEYTFIGLADGQYKIVETQAPAGYNMMSQEISFTITGGTVITENSSSISTVTYTQAVDDDPVTPDVNEASPATFTVGNTPGVELPATGGPGTAFYTASGLVLLLGASLWLILRRRKEQQN